MTLAISTVCTSIAALTVTGVNIYNTNEIPASGERITPCLFPSPQLVTNLMTNRMTFGTPIAAEKEAEYDLNYIFCYMPVGAGRTGLDWYQDMVNLAVDVVETILDNDTITGAVDISPQGGLDFGQVVDPAGKTYEGCNIIFHVVDYLNT